MEARIRALEFSTYHSVFLPVGHKGMELGLVASAAYRKATAANPSGHGLGSGEATTLLAVLRGSLLHTLPPSPDSGVLSRRAVLLLVYAYLSTQPADHITTLCTHCQVAELQGARKGTGILVFKFDGRVTLPSSPEDFQACDKAISEALTQDAVAPLLAIAPSSCSADYGEFIPAQGHGVDLNKVLVSYLCMCGGSRPPSKAPPSAAAQKLKGKAKAKASA